MKVDKLLNKQVDVFKCSIQSKKKWYTTTLINFLQNQIREKDKIFYLRNLNKKDEKAAKLYKKESIVACTPSATFKERRVVGDVKEKTGIIVIDIDKDKNPNLDIDKAKFDVMFLPYVFMTMLSCRGEGIWCAVYYNVDRYIGHVFNALKEDFRNLGYVIDDCGDITRLRYSSWDDNILIKQDVEMYDKYIEDEVKEYDCEGEWVLTKQDLKDIVVAIYVLVNYNNYTKDDYDDWLLDGFRLATIPNRDIGYKLFEMISKASDNYGGPEDVEEKFKECCRTTTYTTNILGYYINKIKDIYGPDWRYRVNDLLAKKGVKI